eukprot:SAG22_NODE_14631_length_369_cov_0.951852_2_plen_32_part_01
MQFTESEKSNTLIENPDLKCMVKMHVAFFNSG